MSEMFEDRRYLIPFRAALLPQIFTEVLVIGSGCAGLRAALAAAEHSDVIVAAKGEIKHSNTYWAQGGIAAVQPDVDDSIDSHVADTLEAGADLCDEPVVRRVVDEGRARIEELRGWGLPFDLDDDGRIALGREGGHSRHRILHAAGDQTGKALSQTLRDRVIQHESVRLFEKCFVLDLLTLEGATGRCVGAVTHHPKYGLQVIWAKATILASGGSGMMYRESTNPNVATGDGLAMAWRAGAVVADMAFMQFHPTTLYIAGASRALITEAVRGEGAHLIDRHGYRFMHDYDERGELAPRDIVSRAILKQSFETNHSHVLLDCRHIEAFPDRFPGIFKLLQNFDLDPGKEPIPIHPSAHYMIGGVWTDEVGRTSIPGLYAAGEVACTGLHGANRLASNSLPEGLVFGHAAGVHCQAEVQDSAGPTGPVKIISDIPLSTRSELDLADVKSSLRSVMWRHVGMLREGDRMREVMEMLEFWGRYTLDKIFDERVGWETQNMLQLGYLMTRSATWRTESRGTHYRTDHPDRDDTFRVHDTWTRGRDTPETRPVIEPSTTASPSGVRPDVSRDQT